MIEGLLASPCAALIAFSDGCLWWDDVGKASVRSVRGRDLLYCPYCGARCNAVTMTTSRYLELARRFELLGFVGHRDLIAWVRGRCYKTRTEAWSAYTRMGCVAS